MRAAAATAFSCCRLGERRLGFLVREIQADRARGEQRAGDQREDQQQVLAKQAAATGPRHGAARGPGRERPGGRFAGGDRRAGRGRGCRHFAIPGGAGLFGHGDATRLTAQGQEPTPCAGRARSAPAAATIALHGVRRRSREHRNWRSIRLFGTRRGTIVFRRRLSSCRRGAPGPSRRKT